MNLPVTEPFDRQAGHLRMLLIDAFLAAETWSDMVEVGEAMAKLRRHERDWRKEREHLHPKIPIDNLRKV